MSVLIKIHNETASPAGHTTVSLRCPGCGNIGTFERLVNLHDLQSNHNGVVSVLGQRKCPNAKCRTHVFFVQKIKDGSLVAVYPAERLHFDSSDIPSEIANALEEAVMCHANLCYVAAGIMVRKTLEQLCHAQSATGSNLKERIKALRFIIVLPTDLLDGLDDLRLLGNDAAHVEAQIYNQVGKEEVEVAIEVTKEILKAVYQHVTLVSRLRALKK